MLDMATRIHDRHDNRPRHQVREWRLRRGFTLEQVAEKIGYNKGSLSAIENYKKPLLEWHIYALADAFGIEPDQLFRHPDAPSIDALMRGAPADVWDNVLTMAAALVAKARTS